MAMSISTALLKKGAIEELLPLVTNSFGEPGNGGIITRMSISGKRKMIEPDPPLGSVPRLIVAATRHLSALGSDIPFIYGH